MKKTIETRKLWQWIGLLSLIAIPFLLYGGESIKLSVIMAAISGFMYMKSK